MKKKKHNKRNNDRKNFGGRDRGEKFSNKRSMRNNDQQIIRNMQSGKIKVEDLEDYYDDHSWRNQDDETVKTNVCHSQKHGRY